MDFLKQMSSKLEEMVSKEGNHNSSDKSPASSDSDSGSEKGSPKGSPADSPKSSAKSGKSEGGSEKTKLEKIKEDDIVFVWGPIG